jgi:hypothetical protein
MQRNEALTTAEGRARVAVKVTRIGDRWRYDYAVQNLDYARAVTSGTNPNIQVLDARGFGSFAVPLAQGGQILATSYAHPAPETGNTWSVSTPGGGGAGEVRWSQPASGANAIDWGNLFRFSIDTNAAPVPGTVSLSPARSGTPASYTVSSLVPGTPPLFADGFE